MTYISKVRCSECYLKNREHLTCHLTMKIKSFCPMSRSIVVELFKTIRICFAVSWLAFHSSRVHLIIYGEVRFIYGGNGSYHTLHETNGLLTIISRWFDFWDAWIYFRSTSPVHPKRLLEFDGKNILTVEVFA